MVNIFLEDGNAQALFLSIPRGDIERLSLFPHKWLKFVMFSICGTHGVLSATPQGQPVEDDARITDMSDLYYYTHALTRLRRTPPLHQGYCGWGFGGAVPQGHLCGSGTWERWRAVYSPVKGC
jgi:hypothetical protein